jgi:hypothetical protein
MYIEDFAKRNFKGLFFIKYVMPLRYFPKLYIVSISGNLCGIHKTHSLVTTEGFHRVEQSPFSLSMAFGMFSKA